ncbi:MAG: isoleucine--tRNA ligase, partial [Candidatus Omnitrophota bacterium]
PGHGQEDYHTGIKYNLLVLMPVDDKGNFDSTAGEFTGMNVFSANEKIIQSLKEKGALLGSGSLLHSYPHCWRCKQPVIFRATEQWFLSVEHKDLREKLIRSIKEEVKWIPVAGQERILGMVATRPDWCLSRQRYWGVPIPALHCAKCGKWVLDEKVILNFAQLVLKEGTDCWFTRKVEDLVPPQFNCPACGGTEFFKGKDILDVWFDSGVSHQAVLKNREGMKLPCDLYLEGSDQHRGWFQASLIPAIAIDKQPPFKAVLTHGFVVDGSGRKMSKSMGNVISPLEVIKDFGADILRLWVASSDYKEDIRISQQILERLIEAYRKIRNTLRFLLSNLYDFNPSVDASGYAELLELDKWALSRLFATMSAVNDSYEQFDFCTSYRQIYRFCNEELSAVYLDILKDRLYTFAADSRERRSAQTVLYHCLSVLVRMLSPILPFTCEEAFKYSPKDKGEAAAASVHLLDWAAADPQWNNPAVEEKFRTLVELRPFVLKALEDFRASGKIGSSLEAKIILETIDGKRADYLEGCRNVLPEFFIVSQAEIQKVAGLSRAALSEEFKDLSVVIEPAQGRKCSRCWNFRLEVGEVVEHPDLCGRCLGAIDRK